jgi:hypothetical protein
VADYHRADRLTDLHPRGSVGVGDDPIKFGPFDGPAINIESAGASPKGLYGSAPAKVADGAEIDEANTAGAKGRHLFPGDPTVDDAPVVERHVVSAIRHNGSIIRDAIDVGAVDDENAARDLVRCPWPNPPIHVDRFGLESCTLRRPPLSPAPLMNTPLPKTGEPKRPIE